MKAAFVAVGSELLGTDRLDTNSLFVAGHLERFGVDLIEKRVVGDDEDRIGSTVRELAAAAELVIVSGGLGPTADDVTREGVARAFGLELHVDEEIVDRIRDRFARHGYTMPEVNRRQAELLDGAIAIPNRHGTAPGQLLDVDGARIALLPGVPVELRAMTESAIVPWLEERSDGRALVTRSVSIACAHESGLEERLAPVYEEFGRAGISTLAGAGQIRIQVKRADPDPIVDRVVELLGRRIFGRDDETLESAVGALLVERGARIVVAESCTGGLLAERLTRVPGSSAYFEGGVIAYSNEVKTRELGVPAELIEREGAVSKAVAQAMAEGVRRRFAPPSDVELWAVAMTGVAGPGGGTKAKPVGTVEVAVAGPMTEARTLALPGDRAKIRRLSTQWALELVRRLLLGDEPG